MTVLLRLLAVVAAVGVVVAVFAVARSQADTLDESSPPHAVG